MNFIYIYYLQALNNVQFIIVINRDNKVDKYIFIEKNLKLYDQKVTLSFFFINITITLEITRKNDEKLE